MKKVYYFAFSTLNYFLPNRYQPITSLSSQLRVQDQQKQQPQNGHYINLNPMEDGDHNGIGNSAISSMQWGKQCWQWTPNEAKATAKAAADNYAAKKSVHGHTTKAVAIRWLV